MHSLKYGLTLLPLRKDFIFSVRRNAQTYNDHYKISCIRETFDRYKYMYVSACDRICLYGVVSFQKRVYVDERFRRFSL